MSRTFASSFSFVVLVCVGCGDNGHNALDAAVDATPPAAWTDLVFGGPADDDLLDVAVVGDEVIIAGYRDGELGQVNIEPSGNAVGVIEAFALDGTPRWQRTFDTPGADTVEAVHVGANDIAFVGRTTGAFPGFTNAGQIDAFVGRTPRGAATSTPVFQLGDERPQHPVRIERDDTGAILIAGYDDSYVVGSAVIAAENPWFARVTAEGGFALDWMRRLDTPGADWVYGLAAAGPASELVVGGQVQTGSERGPFVQHLDATGAPRWSRRFGQVGVDAVTGIARGPDGLLYVAGSTFEQVGARSYGEQDIFVVALDPTTGATVRTMQAGSATSDYPRDLAVAADGTVYVVGETLGALPGSVAAGDFDVAVLRFAPDDTWTGAWQRGTAGDDTGRAIAVANDGVFIVGYTDGALVDGVAPGGRRDGFVIRLASADLASP